MVSAIQKTILFMQGFVVKYEVERNVYSLYSKYNASA